MSAARRALAAAALAVACGACAHGGGAPGARAGSAPLRADSITIGLWHLDESGGATCADDGPHSMRGTAGIDTRTDFGRFGNAREFTPSAESWVFVPYDPSMNTAHLTVEAWIRPTAYGIAEDTPIAGRWSEYAGEQSWLLSLVGLQRNRRLTDLTLPGYHENFVTEANAMHLMFTFQPLQPGPPLTYFSTAQIALDRWSHVVVSHDGAVVRFWIDGQLDAQFATRSGIRDGSAPLLIGNYFDTRLLTGFSGDLRLGGRIAYSPVYAFQGTIDEVRLSSEARAP